MAHAGHREIAAEAPGPHARPAQVLHRVAEVGQFPVDDGMQAVGTDQHVAEPEVAVHHGLARAGGTVLLQPAEGELEGGDRVAEPVEHLAVLVQLVDGLQEVQLVGRDGVDGGEGAPELGRQPGASVAVGVVAQDAPGDRFPVDELADQVPGAERRVTGPAGDHAGHRDAGGGRGLEQQGLVLHRAGTRRAGALALEHQLTTARAERPRLPGGAAGESTQVRHGRAEHRLETGYQFVGCHDWRSCQTSYPQAALTAG